jgi:hypothetical protein
MSMLIERKILRDGSMNEDKSMKKGKSKEEAESPEWIAVPI